MAGPRLCLALLALFALGTSGYPLDGPNSSEEVHEPVPAKVQEEVVKEDVVKEDVVKDEVVKESLEEDAVKDQPALEEAKPEVSSEESKSQEDVKVPEEESQEDKVVEAKSDEDSSKPLGDDEQGFDSYDQDRNGFIDKEEWERKVEIEEEKQKFLVADANNDERISQEEYQLWSSPEPQENVNDVYVPLDIVSQPVDEVGIAPVGRSAEELGVSDVRDVIVDVAPVIPDDAPIIDGPIPVQDESVESLGVDSQEEPIVVIKDEPVLVEEVLIEEKKDVVQEEPKLVEVVPPPQVKSVEVPVDDIKEPESLLPEKPVVLPASAPAESQPVEEEKPKSEVVAPKVIVPVEEVKKEVSEVVPEVVSEAVSEVPSSSSVASVVQEDPKPSSVSQS